MFIWSLACSGILVNDLEGEFSLELSVNIVCVQDVEKGHFT